MHLPCIAFLALSSLAVLPEPQPQTCLSEVVGSPGSVSPMRPAQSVLLSLRPRCKLAVGEEFSLRSHSDSDSD